MFRCKFERRNNEILWTLGIVWHTLKNIRIGLILEFGNAKNLLVLILLIENFVTKAIRERIINCIREEIFVIMYIMKSSNPSEDFTHAYKLYYLHLNRVL